MCRMLAHDHMRSMLAHDEVRESSKLIMRYRVVAKCIHHALQKHMYVNLYMHV
jgi:hypothetical protein